MMGKRQRRRSQQFYLRDVQRVLDTKAHNPEKQTREEYAKYLEVYTGHWAKAMSYAEFKEGAAC